METIPIRHIATTQKEPNLLGNFTIRKLQDLLDGKDMFHELHRHDFYFILALKKGFEIEYSKRKTSISICRYATFIKLSTKFDNKTNIR